ncbi:MAG: GTPase domain-containing protein, partial [Candidatus Sumerlaeia bacterium]|nr:GTPase domain-containing protein [Candidatus Sumerlaeia bacterium]
MATLNYAFKELTCKIVYYGCGLCGKTTNLIHIHKTVPQKFRGELVSLATEQDRTLFFDFLPLDLGEVKGFKTKFQLYTVPGQVYYNATRKLVLRGVDGLVFVVDSQKDRLQENIDSLENLKQNLAEYGYHLQAGADDSEGIPWVLQYNKRDMPQVATTEELNAALNTYGVPVYDAVAVNGGGVKDTLKGISSLVIRKLNSDTGATAPAAGATPAKPASPDQRPTLAPQAQAAPA